MTLDQAKALTYGQTIYHIEFKNADGTPVRARVNGAPKTWKTRPYSIRIPMKRGLRDTFQLGCGVTDKPIDQPLEAWSIVEPS